MQNKISKLYIGSTIYSYLLNFIIVLYAFLLPFSSTFTIHTAPYLLIIFWLLEGRFNYKFQILKNNKPTSFLILFFLFSSISLLWTNDLHHGIELIKLYFAHIIVFIIIITSIQKKFVETLISIFIVAMFISELASYGIMLGLWSLKGHIGDPTPFMSHIPYSIYLVTTIILLLGRVLKKNENLKLKLLEVLFIFSSTANLFLNGGRTGQIAFIFGILIFILIYFRFKIKYLVPTLIIIITTFTIAYNFSPIFKSRADYAKKDIEKTLHHDLSGSIGIRVAAKIVGYAAVSNSPLYGYGIGDDKEMFDRYWFLKNMENIAKSKPLSHSHDQYLQILLQTGIIGLFFFLGFIFYIFRVVSLNTSNEYRLKKASLVSFMVIFIFTFFTDIAFNSHMGTLFIFMSAVLYCRVTEDCGSKDKNINANSYTSERMKQTEQLLAGYNIETVVKKIEALISDPARLLKMKSGDRARVGQVCIEKNVEETLRVIDEAVR